MTSRDTGRRFALSLLIGLLAIPLSAAAGFAIVNGIATRPAEPNTTLALPPTTTTSTAAAAGAVIVEPVTTSADDLSSACGTDGMTLVGFEAEGTITDIQQAALDALRQICEDAGTPLPGPAAPPPVVRTVQAAANGVSSGPDSVVQSGEHHDDHEDEDDDHEDEDDDHEDEEHEDDD